MSKVVGVGVSHRLVSPLHPRKHYRVRCWRCPVPGRQLRGSRVVSAGGRALGPTGFQLAVGISLLDLGSGLPRGAPSFPAVSGPRVGFAGSRSGNLLRTETVTV